MIADRNEILKEGAVCLGTGLILGLPGTFGSIVGVGLYRLMARLGAMSYAGTVAVLGLVGIFICGQTARDLGEIDPGVIV